MNPRPFIKMHGLGNDFVVVDARTEPFVLDDDAVGARGEDAAHRVVELLAGVRVDIAAAAHHDDRGALDGLGVNAQLRHAFPLISNLPRPRAKSSAPRRRVAEARNTR